MNAYAALLPAVVHPAVEERQWLSTDHCAGPVLDLLDALGWTIVDPPEANVHATSPDGRVYVGWLPEDAAAWKLGILWQVRVQPFAGDAWVQEFGLHTPAEAVAGFLAALVTHSSRCPPTEGSGPVLARPHWRSFRSASRRTDHPPAPNGRTSHDHLLR